ncbi:MAG TPA: ZIP family metal transporter [Candidatus Nanoarchaeia archaeon]|nr:ZIP family metal transporter [Candidatus Nanoarchaeia archaeon]
MILDASSVVFGYTLVSVIIVSLVSLIGISLFSWKKLNTGGVLLFLVSLSAGTLFGDAFLHLLPEAVEKYGFTPEISFVVLGGVLSFFILEKMIHWRHCHGNGHMHNHHGHSHGHHAHSHTHFQKNNVKPIAVLNFLGDGIHNFIDGLIIVGSYFIDIPTGIATTIAVIVHEVPQEIADFGVLLYSGLSKVRAMLLNFLSAAIAIVGALAGYMLGSQSELFLKFILPFAVGGFVYIAGSNLIPELHKSCDLRDSLWHILAFVLGIGLMVALLLLD